MFLEQYDWCVELVVSGVGVVIFDHGLFLVDGLDVREVADVGVAAVVQKRVVVRLLMVNELMAPNHVQLTHKPVRIYCIQSLDMPAVFESDYRHH